MVPIHWYEYGNGIVCAARRFFIVESVNPRCDGAGECRLACLMLSSNERAIVLHPGLPEPGTPETAIKRRLEVGVSL